MAGRGSVVVPPGRPDVRLLSAAGPPDRRPAPPPSHLSLLVPLALVVVALVVVSSVRGSGRAVEQAQRTQVRATVGAVQLDDALHLDLEVVNPGPPAQVVDARVLLKGAVTRSLPRLAGDDRGHLATGRSHLEADLAVQCGPEGPLEQVAGTVVLRLTAGGEPAELRAPLPVERAQAAAEQQCRPMVLSAALARRPAGPGQVRLTVSVRTSAEARVRTVQALSYSGAALEVPGAPLVAGEPGTDTVTAFPVVVPVACGAPSAGLQAVVDGQALPVPLEPEAEQALRAAERAARCG